MSTTVYKYEFGIGNRSVTYTYHPYKEVILDDEGEVLFAQEDYKDIKFYRVLDVVKLLEKHIEGHLEKPHSIRIYQDVVGDEENE